MNRNPQAFGWTDLPAAGRSGPAPALPEWMKVPEATLDWWRVLWAKPQATQWAPDGSTLWTLALLHARLVVSGGSESVAAEMRQHEDRHGLTPKAMLQLRWRIVDDASPPQAAGPAKKAAAKRSAKRRAAALTILEGGGGGPA